MTAILKARDRPALVRRHRHLYPAPPTRPTPRLATAPMTRSASTGSDIRAKVVARVPISARPSAAVSRPQGISRSTSSNYNDDSLRRFSKGNSKITL